MISNEDGGSGLVKIAVGVDDFEGNAGDSGHDVLEASSGGPLSDLSVAEEAQDDGCEDAIESSQKKRDIGGQTSGREACFRRHWGQGVEREGKGSVASQEVTQIGEKRHFQPVGRSGRSRRRED